MTMLNLISTPVRYWKPGSSVSLNVLHEQRRVKEWKCDKCIPDEFSDHLDELANYCNKNGDFLIGIEIDGIKYWEYVNYSPDTGYVFLNDWYEGEQCITIFFVGSLLDCEE